MSAVRTCVAYVLRSPRTESGPCGLKARYMALNVQRDVLTLEATCGRHVNGYMRLGWEVSEI